MDSNAARLFEVGVEAGMRGADVGACVVAGTAVVRRGVEGDKDGCCEFSLSGGMLVDTRWGSTGEDGGTDE
jgi:hypothetical protein